MNKIEFRDNLKIVYKEDNTICYKKCQNSNSVKINDYLLSKGFNNIIETKVTNGFEVRQYVNSIDITETDKISELIYLIMMLHTKTTHYKNISLDEIRDFYENELLEIEETKKYYDEIFSNNITNLLLPPSLFLLIKECSIILNSLNQSKIFLDEWYKVAKNKKRKRVVFNHNNLKLSNFIVGSNKYLINWNNSIIDYSIYDLLSLFKCNFKVIDMIDTYQFYDSKYGLLQEEKYLFFSTLLKIEKISFEESDLKNTKKVHDAVSYLKKVNDFLKYNMKN